tara:strand:- start:338 stop:610 length:273 start_codon:yes stop_codon:yes gene_type:complete
MVQKMLESVSSLFNEKLVQISLVGGVLFYVIASTTTFKFVEEMLQKLGNMVGLTFKLQGTNQMIFHSLVFAVLLGLCVKYIFDPLMRAIK